jgi:hypothetical protein
MIRNGFQSYAIPLPIRLRRIREKNSRAGRAQEFIVFSSLEKNQWLFPL